MHSCITPLGKKQCQRHEWWQSSSLIIDIVEKGLGSDFLFQLISYVGLWPVLQLSHLNRSHYYLLNGYSLCLGHPYNDLSFPPVHNHQQLEEKKQKTNGPYKCYCTSALIYELTPAFRFWTTILEKSHKLNNEIRYICDQIVFKNQMESALWKRLMKERYAEDLLVACDWKTNNEALYPSFLKPPSHECPQNMWGIRKIVVARLQFLRYIVMCLPNLVYSARSTRDDFQRVRSLQWFLLDSGKLVNELKFYFPLCLQTESLSNFWCVECERMVPVAGKTPMPSSLSSSSSKKKRKKKRNNNNNNKQTLPSCFFMWFHGFFLCTWCLLFRRRKYCYVQQYKAQFKRTTAQDILQSGYRALCVVYFRDLKSPSIAENKHIFFHSTVVNNLAEGIRKQQQQQREDDDDTDDDKEYTLRFTEFFSNVTATFGISNDTTTSNQRSRYIQELKNKQAIQFAGKYCFYRWTLESNIQLLFLDDFRIRKYDRQLSLLQNDKLLYTAESSKKKKMKRKKGENIYDDNEKKKATQFKKENTK